MAEIKTKAKGKSIRIPDKAHKVLSAFCKKKGYNLGAFCALSAIEKMKSGEL